MTRIVRYLRDGRVRAAAETPKGQFDDLKEDDVLGALTGSVGTGRGHVDVDDPEMLTLRGVTLTRPIDPPEVWCAGVTYERSRDARVDEAVVKDVYTMVYEANRPELFFKDAMCRRTVGPGQPIAIREDSTWNVPEPEIGVVVGPRGTILGYTIGNDVSSRDIEGANPLYLPQAKVFAGACSIGPAILVATADDDPFEIRMRISDASGDRIWEGTTSTARMIRSFADLVSWLVRDNPVPPGSVLLTGTGLVPPDTFTLLPGHVVDIHVPGIGTLSNPVVLATDLAHV